MNNRYPDDPIMGTKAEWVYTALLVAVALVLLVSPVVLSIQYFRLHKQLQALEAKVAGKSTSKAIVEVHGPKNIVPQWGTIAGSVINNGVILSNATRVVPKPGEVWAYRPKNPYVTWKTNVIIDVLDGYVLYRDYAANQTNSRSLLLFEIESTNITHTLTNR